MVDGPAREFGSSMGPKPDTLEATRPTAPLWRANFRVMALVTGRREALVTGRREAILTGWLGGLACFSEGDGAPLRLDRPRLCGSETGLEGGCSSSFSLSREG